jgi:hypothetical protein
MEGARKGCHQKQPRGLDITYFGDNQSSPEHFQTEGTNQFSIKVEKVDYLDIL